jgi:hypothetical protein
VESTTRLGRHRWKVERSLAWPLANRRLTVRYERRADILTAGAADLFEQWRRDMRFADHSWGRVALPEAGNNGPSGQWLRDKILVPLGYGRTDCRITDCLDTARLNAGQQRRISETYLPVIGCLGLPTPTMEPTRPPKAGSLGRPGRGTWNDWLESWTGPDRR